MARLLIIEDDKLIRWSLKEIFSEEGYAVDTTSTVNAALKYAQENQYQAIIVDLEVDEYSPAEMIETLSRYQPKAALIVLSAMNRQEAENIIKDINIFAVMDKPFQTEAVKSIVKNALEQHGL